ncbi:hypothetical protein GRJ2_001244500 [Grus japonensis]|uniref:Uncharacterized protein n=1 Tax=Grus japonensis TaxID=30415 RepID=A0ABC9WTF1_GRUJA
MDDVSCQLFTVRHPTLRSVLHFIPQLQASWNPTAKTPASFVPVLWKTRSSAAFPVPDVEVPPWCLPVLTRRTHAKRFLIVKPM